MGVDLFQTGWFEMGKILKVFAFSVLVGTLAACGASDSPSVDLDPQTQQIINQYTAPNIDINIALNKVAADCMKEAGFKGRKTYFTDPQSHAVSGLVGVIATEEEARLGYSATISPDQEDSMEGAELEAYSGSEKSKTVSVELTSGAILSRPLEGCAAQAGEKIYGSVEDSLFYESFINELLSAGGVETSKEIINSASAELEKYTSCIKETTGFTTHSLEETEKLVAEELGTYRSLNEKPSQQEISYALADYRCQQESGYVETINKKYLEKISSWLISHEDLILKVRDIEQKAQESAQEVLNS